ncbi:hypothetical protein QTN25_000282 [Entamoeba marina]
MSKDDINTNFEQFVQARDKIGIKIVDDPSLIDKSNPEIKQLSTKDEIALSILETIIDPFNPHKIYE